MSSMNHMLFFVKGNKFAIKISIKLKTIKKNLVLKKIIHAFDFLHVTPISGCLTNYTDMQTLFSCQNFNFEKKHALHL